MTFQMGAREELSEEVALGCGLMAPSSRYQRREATGSGNGKSQVPKAGKSLDYLGGRKRPVEL